MLSMRAVHSGPSSIAAAADVPPPPAATSSAAAASGPIPAIAAVSSRDREQKPQPASWGAGANSPPSWSLPFLQQLRQRPGPCQATVISAGRRGVQPVYSQSTAPPSTLAPPLVEA